MRGLALLLLAAPAHAEPAIVSSRDARIAVRVHAAAGHFKEVTWTAPGVDLVGSLDVGAGVVSIAAGYVPIDSHVFLADGEIVHGALAGGIPIGDRVRAAAVFDLAYVAYHGDPDLLAEHPGVDLLTRNGGITPAAGFELAYRFTRVASAGLYARVALRKLTVFDDGAGDRATARLILGGAFLELQLR